MRGMKILLLTLVPAVFLAGCAWDEGFFSLRSKIEGAWVYEDASYGKPVLVFRKDGVYQIDLTGDGTYDIIGDYGFTDRHLRLRSTEGTFSEEDCTAGGFYGYVPKDGHLSFEYYVDQCQQRASFLSHTWIRKVIRDEEIRQQKLAEQRRMQEEKQKAAMEARRKQVKKRGEVTRGHKAKGQKVKADAEEMEYQPIVNFTHK